MTLPTIIPAAIERLRLISELSSVTGALGAKSNLSTDADHFPSPKAMVFIQKIGTESSTMNFGGHQQQLYWVLGVLLSLQPIISGGNAIVNNGLAEKLQSSIISKLCGHTLHNAVTPLEFIDSQYQPNAHPKLHYIMQFRCRTLLNS